MFNKIMNFIEEFALLAAFAVAVAPLAVVAWEAASKLGLI